MDTDIKTIEKCVRKWTSDNIGEKFEFRPNQLNAIVYIINNILNNDRKTTVIQAPTGTGKSLICIISAGVLAKYYKKKSYILASDLSLWRQYAEAIDNYKLKDFGYLMGSIGNYKCHVFGTDYSLGKCHLHKIPLQTLKNKQRRESAGYKCAEKCIYILQRIKAESSSVSLLTYQLWLYQMNLVEHNSNEGGFLKRDVIFCDECHNIPDIVQRYAEPVINEDKDKTKILDIVDYAYVNNINVPTCYENTLRSDFVHKMYSDENSNGNQSTAPARECLDIRKIKGYFEYIINCLDINENHNNGNKAIVNLDVLKDYRNLLAFINYLSEEGLKDLKTKKEIIDDDDESETLQEDKEKKKKEINNTLTSFSTLSWMHNYYSMITEFINAVEQAGEQYIIVEESQGKSKDNHIFTLNCVKEDYLCKTYLLDQSEYKVLTSATVGNVQSFKENIGADDIDFIDIPNFFDFSKSPIYFIPNYKMSYKDKKRDFPKIQQLIYTIVDSKNFKDKHGMINTGSYENARVIYDNAPAKIRSRLCLYNSSKDKDMTIHRFKQSKNKILIGPTLVEGVDLPGDLCRFIIIAKVPYPNLTSKIVKAKMELFPLWYQSTTSNIIIQNIGRGVRKPDDYCVTFIVDGCFEKLYKMTWRQYSRDIQSRFHMLPIDKSTEEKLQK